MKFNTETTAIIVTDPQIDYVSTTWKCAVEFGWDVSKLEEMVQRIWDFIERIKKDFDVILLQNEEAIATYPHNMPMILESDELCVKWTQGHNFYPTISTDWCKIIQKNRPSWFGRELWWELSELEVYLLEQWKTDLIHAWVLAWRCVNANIMWAQDAGFKNHILTDLTWNPLWDKMQEEERVTRALWESHYTMSRFDSSELKAA